MNHSINKRELFHLVIGTVIVGGSIILAFLVPRLVMGQEIARRWYQYDLYNDHAHLPRRNVVLLGQTEVAAYDVVVQEGIAYVAARDAGLYVLDVSDPSSPTRIGHCNCTSGEAWGLVVSGTLAYIANGGTGLQIVDVSTPTTPTCKGAYDTSRFAWGVAVSGPLAYVVDGDAGLRVIDVSNPVSPTEVGAYDTPGSAYGVAVSGTLAYVADWGAGLRVIDVSNPISPKEVGAYDTPGLASGVVVSGTLAYVADWEAGLRVIDVSNPISPTEVGSCDTPGHANGVAISGTLVYVADGHAGLRVIDVSNPISPTEVGFYDTIQWYADEVAISGAWAYLAARTEGLLVLRYLGPLQAGFVALPTVGVAPLEVVFINTSSGDYIASLWDLGDGITSTQTSLTHTYTTKGVYTVTLTVSGPGSADTLTRTNYITVYAPVHAAFTASPTSGVVPLTVAFTNTSSGDYTATLWNFGDGVTSTQEHPTHVYTAVGTYTVTLNISGPGGNGVETKADYITVKPYYLYLPLVLRRYP